MTQIRMDWIPLTHGLNVLRPPFDALKRPQVQPCPKLAQPVYSMLLLMPSL